MPNDTNNKESYLNHIVMMKKTGVLAIVMGCVSYGVIAQANKIENTGNVGIGTTNPIEKLQIGNAFTFHDGGHDVIGFSYGASGGLDLNTNAYAGEIRFDPTTGKLRLGTSTELTNNPSTRFSINSKGYVGIGSADPQTRFHVINSNGEGYAPQISGNIATFQSNNTSGYYTSVNVISGTQGTASFFFGDKDSGAMGGFRYDNKNNSLAFRTNGGDNKLFINSSGAVGIGTNTVVPNTRLTVNGHVNIGGKGNYRLRSRHIDGKHYENSNVDDLYLNYNTGKNVLVGFGGKDSNMYVSGNVGIGTANPTQKLEVKGKMFLNSGIDDDGIYWARHNMTMGTIPGSYNHNVFRLKPGGSSKGRLFSILEMYTANSETSHDKKVQIHASGTSYFNGGNVGIGTTDTKGYKLGVKGKIAAEEVKVALYNSWPDFVFEDSYALPSLQEVERYIQEKGHLENIPSAEEVAENGIQLGAMNAKLLQKIEELTLYIIEQDKKTTQLVKEMAALKAELKDRKE